MKKIFALVLFLVLGKFSYSQYPLQQNLGNDSTIVISKGATQSRFVNVTYTDTASANLQRIRQYPASLIATTSGGLRFWIRNSSATGWIEISTTSSTVGVTSVATNNATGITGGTITSTGTLAIDTLLISTRAWRQKGIDSVASLITGSVSGTTNYVSKFTATNSLGNSQIFDNGTSVGFATATPDSLLTVELGTHLKRGVRLSGLPQAPGTKSLRIDANGTLSIVDTTSGGGVGTVTSVATNNGTGITGGTITTAGTLAIDTLLISTRAWRQKGIDSLQANINGKLNISDTASMLSPYINNVGYGLGKTSQTVYADSATLSNYYLRRKDSLTATNPLGYVTKKVLADTAAAIRSATSGGTVTSVATNNGTGITGGTITTSGTLAIDTTVISTRAWRQKGVDSLQANINLKLNISDTANMLNPYLRKVDTTNIWITNVYRKTATDSVFYVKGGNSTFAYRDSIGSGSGGGGGGKVYYLNGSVNQGTFGGLTMYALGDTAITGASADFTRATTGTIANFITNVNQPYLISIPSGIWVINAYMSESGGGANHAEVYAILETWNGSTLTSIATSPIEEITNGSTPDLYTFGISLPTTTISLTDRIVIQFYIQNTNGKTVTLYTQNGKVGEVITTFTTGIGALNGLTAPSQFFATGTSGTDFNISSLTDTHTFNLPTASAINRGALSSADWTTFNNKGSVSSVATNNGTGITGGTITTSGTLAIDTLLISTRAWRQKGIDSVASLINSNISGTTNYVPKFTGTNTIGNSNIFDDGTNVGLFTASPLEKLDVRGRFLSVGTTTTTESAMFVQSQWGGGPNKFVTKLAANSQGNVVLSSGYNIASATAPSSATVTEILRADYLGNVGIGGIAPDSMLTVNLGTHLKRGVRMSGLPTGVGTKALRIDANGRLSIADTTTAGVGTVTSVATNNGTGITGGTITTSGTLAIDTLLISTRAWRQKGIDSVASLITGGYVPNSRTITINGTSQDLSANRTYNVGTVTSVATSSATGITGGTFTTSGTIAADTLLLSTRLWRQKGIDSVAALPRVTSVATNTGTGITGGTITTSGTIAADTLLLSTRAWRQKGIDSVAALPRVTSVGSGYGLSGGTITTSGTLLVDSATLSNYYLRRKDSLTATNLLGYVTRKILADTASAIRSAAGTGTVTSVATNTGTGITGGTITTSGTLAIDTLLISTRAWRQKGIDSVQANLTAGLALKVNISDTASMLTPYLRKIDTTAMLSPYLRSNVASATYVPQTRTITINGTSQDLSANRTYNVGTVTSVATSSATGITGGTFTTSGTIAADTLLLSTRAWRQKGIDSVAALANTKISGSGTTNYIPKFTSSSAIGNSIMSEGSSLITVNAGNIGTNAGYGLVWSGDATRIITPEDNVAGALIQTPGVIRFNSGSSEKMRLDASGNLGLGTSSPNSNGGASAKVLHINSSGVGDYAVTHYTNGSTGSNAGDGLIVGNIGADAYIFNYENSPISFGTNSTERMRITSGGQVGIGTTSVSRTLDIQAAEATLRLTSSTGTNTVYSQFSNTSGNFYIGKDNSTGTAFGVANGTLLYESGANPMVFFTNSAERMRITSGGDIGIGTTTIGSKLQVNGGAAIGYSASTAAPTNGLAVSGSLNVGTGVGSGDANMELGIGRTAAGNAYIDMVGDLTYTDYGLRTIRFSGVNGISEFAHRGTGNFQIRLQEAANMVFSTTNTERMRITSGGKLLLGATSIAASGEVQQVIARSGSSYLEFQNTTSNTGATIGTSGENFIVYTNSGALGSETYTERMRITSGGNVGIGTTSPNQKLSVAGKINFASYETDQDEFGFWVTTGATGGVTMATAGATNLLFRTNSSERMRITSGGNVGIGTTAPSGRLHIDPADNEVGLNISTSSLTSANAQSLIDLTQTWNTTGNPTAIKLNVTNTASGTSSKLMDLQVGGTSQFQVTKGGAIQTVGGVPWKLTGGVVTLGGSNLQGISVDVNGTTYYLVTGYLPEPEPDPAALPASGPSANYKTYNKPTPVKSAQDAKIQALERELAELKEMVKKLASK